MMSAILNTTTMYKSNKSTKFYMIYLTGRGPMQALFLAAEK